MPDLTRRFLASELMEPSALALLMEVRRLAEGGETDATTPSSGWAPGPEPSRRPAADPLAGAGGLDHDDLAEVAPPGTSRPRHKGYGTGACTCAEAARGVRGL